MAPPAREREATVDLGAFAFAAPASADKWLRSSVGGALPLPREEAVPTADIGLASVFRLASTSAAATAAAASAAASAGTISKW